MGPICPVLCSLDSEHPWRTVAAQSSKQGAGGPGSAMAWKEAALPVLEVYTESTDGSYVEEKESALVWHHRDADPDFGAWQAKELLDHLESVLANEPVVVRSGHQQVEVKPQVRGSSHRVTAPLHPSLPSFSPFAPAASSSPLVPSFSKWPLHVPQCGKPLVYCDKVPLQTGNSCK